MLVLALVLPTCTNTHTHKHLLLTAADSRVPQLAPVTMPVWLYQQDFPRLLHMIQYDDCCPHQQLTVTVPPFVLPFRAPLTTVCPTTFTGGNATSSCAGKFFQDTCTAQCDAGFEGILIATCGLDGSGSGTDACAACHSPKKKTAKFFYSICGVFNQRALHRSLGLRHTASGFARAAQSGLYFLEWAVTGGTCVKSECAGRAI